MLFLSLGFHWTPRALTAATLLLLVSLAAAAPSQYQAVVSVNGTLTSAAKQAVYRRYLTQQSSTVSSISETVDNREEVMDSTQVPYNTLGVIVMTDKKGNLASCTGALIAADVVLTAAHCLHDPETGIDVASAKFAVGYNRAMKTPAPYGYANMVSATLLPAFVKCGTGAYTACHQANDFGIIRIDAKYSLWMQYSFNNSDTGSEIVNTAGYPGDLDDCFDPGTNCAPYHVSCTDGTIKSGTAVVTSQCFTYSGQSGSPVWLYYSSTGKRLIRGILTSSIGTSGGGGFFTLITQSVFNTLQNWISQSS